MLVRCVRDHPGRPLALNERLDTHRYPGLRSAFADCGPTEGTSPWRIRASEEARQASYRSHSIQTTDRARIRDVSPSTTTWRSIRRLKSPSKSQRLHGMASPRCRRDGRTLCTRGHASLSDRSQGAIAPAGSGPILLVEKLRPPLRKPSLDTFVIHSRMLAHPKVLNARDRCS